MCWVQVISRLHVRRSSPITSAELEAISGAITIIMGVTVAVTSTELVPLGLGLLHQLSSYRFQALLSSITMR